MTPKLDQKASVECLRSAKPHLICRVESDEGRLVEPEGGQRLKLTPYVSEVETGWDEVIIEGYDPDGSPLGCPVYWRVVNRGDQQLYCSTFLAKRHQIIRVWGTTALSYCDPFTGMVVVRIETLLAGSATSSEKSGCRPAASSRKNGASH